MGQAATGSAPQINEGIAIGAQLLAQSLYNHRIVRVGGGVEILKGGVVVQIDAQGQLLRQINHDYFCQTYINGELVVP